MSDVLVAVVNSIDAFSVRKYNEPPVTPSSSISSSSRHESAKTLKRFVARLPISISTYARMKRSVKISAGDSPLWSNIFVNTNVVPQMATVKNATRW